MRDAPGGADLLLAARDTLTGEVLAGLRGGQRYSALMVANAIGMVARELGARERQRAAERAVAAFAAPGTDPEDPDAVGRSLCQAIRAGRHDGDGGLHAALLARTVVAVAIARPAALTEDERRRLDEQR